MIQFLFIMSVLLPIALFFMHAALKLKHSKKGENIFLACIMIPIAAIVLINMYKTHGAKAKDFDIFHADFAQNALFIK